MWKESYAIGIHEIDKQHKELFLTIGRLLAALREAEGAAPLNSTKEAVNTLHFLREYVVEHFATEEAYMEALGHPGLQEHRRMHQNFAKAVKATEDKIYETAFDVKTVRALSSLLLSWLKNHVTGVDMTIVKGAVAESTLKAQEEIVSEIYMLT